MVGVAHGKYSFHFFAALFPVPDYILIEGSFEVKPPTYGQMQKQSWEASEESREQEETRSTCATRCSRETQCFSDPVLRVSRFRGFAVLEGRKLGLLKGQVWSYLAE